MTTTAVNVRVQDFDVYVGRAALRARDPRCHVASEWANPYRVQESIGETLDRYSDWLDRKLADDPAATGRLLSLRGKRLGCWCKPNPCHADVLIRKIEELSARASRAEPKGESRPGVDEPS